MQTFGSKNDGAFLISRRRRRRSSRRPRGRSWPRSRGRGGGKGGRAQGEVRAVNNVAAAIADAQRRADAGGKSTTPRPSVRVSATSISSRGNSDAHVAASTSHAGSGIHSAPVAGVERAPIQTRAAFFGGRVFRQRSPLVLRLVVSDDVRLALQPTKTGAAARRARNRANRRPCLGPYVSSSTPGACEPPLHRRRAVGRAI